MSTMFDAPRFDRNRNVKVIATGALAVLLVGAGVLAYAAYSRAHPAGETPAATTAARASTLSIGTISGSASVAVDAPLKLTGATGLGSIGVTLNYEPSVVSVLDVKNGNVPQSALTWRHDAHTGSIIMLLTTSLPKGVSGDDTFAVVTLKAKDGAVGELSPLTLTVRSAIRSGGESATVQPASGTFRNGVPGDVSGDGIVDQADYDRLADYLVGDPVTIVALNADLNADGKVTDADAVLLHQKLAGGA